MTTGADVLEMLCPNGGWVISGNDFHSIIWTDGLPKCTENEFNAGFAQVDSIKAQNVAEAQAKRQALLDKLGITEDEAKLLLS